jgi:hypothetical protein
MNSMLERVKIVFDNRAFKSLSKIVLRCGQQFETLCGTRYIASQCSRHLFLACHSVCDVTACVYVIFSPTPSSFI